MDEEQIITLFFARSEQAIEALDAKYGKLFHSLSYHIVNDRQDADECVNDAYLGAWNAIPPAKPDSLLPYMARIVRNISLKCYWKKGAASETVLTPLLCRKSRSVFQTERAPRKRWRQGSSPASLRAFWIRCPQRTA